MLIALPGCGNSAAGNGRLTVAATTTQAADLTRQVATGRADVVGILPANADPHGYEVRPKDVDAIAGADVIVRSGGEVDQWMDDVLKSAGTEAPVVTLMRGPEPHWWQDPLNAVDAVDRIRAALTRADPNGAGSYDSAAQEYIDRLRSADRAIAACWTRVPEEQRKLVTTHDALGAYAARYGLKVVGAVIPSRSTRGQASAGDTARLIALIKRERVRAIFPEASVSARVEQAIARETGARIGGELYADTLGPGDYLGSLRHNTKVLVDGVSGGRVTCSI
jgi:ABC-type Zn uptake system ZnuABC Zn-binding protein ZnuA